MVEVFQTSVAKRKVAKKLLEQLHIMFPDFTFNFDLEDCDNILRVESAKGGIDSEPIIEVVQGHGHHIKVLPD
ncbi:hypothetical protein [Muricauda sp. MAR_2010_75]|jgi:hypothetical protein|uniref:hypothetical protein n=1 Tax=Allomuricauda sp. MAR_2010_75 TaxID=1250232 RepID=UPI00055DD201|nr:hypothetical protein [Muricauda sp. MAR_2010_75]